MSSHDIYCLRRAKFMTAASDDPSTKIGVVIAPTDTRLLVFGTNKLPVGINRVLETLPRDEKLELIVHAEMDAICTAARYGDRLLGATLYMVCYDATEKRYWGSAPCTNCTKHVIAAGISRVVTLVEGPPERWGASVNKGEAWLKEAGVLYEEIDHAQLTD